MDLLNKSKKYYWIDLSREAFIDNEYDLMKELDKLSELQLFVKRLVENDKIDYKKFEDSIERYYDLEDYYLSEQVLMFLSIQDNPIEFLISILK